MMHLTIEKKNRADRGALDRSLSKYLSDIGKYKRISSEEEIMLTARIRKGDLEAQRKMVEANLKFVVSVAKLYQNQGLSLGDLISEGNLGLIKATKLFDETRGFKFISYAVWWIKQSILSAIAEHNRTVRLPMNQVDNVIKLKKVYKKFESENGRKPTIEELAEKSQLSARDITFTIQNLSHDLSLDSPIDPNGSTETKLMQTIPDTTVESPDKNLLNESLKKDVEATLSKLDEREKKIIEMSLGFDRKRGATLGEIGDDLNLTRERIRQIKDKAIRKLRRSDKTKMLIKYLG